MHSYLGSIQFCLTCWTWYSFLIGAWRCSGGRAAYKNEYQVLWFVYLFRKLVNLTGAWTLLKPRGTVAPVGFPCLKSKTEGGCWCVPSACSIPELSIRIDNELTPLGCCDWEELCLVWWKFWFRNEDVVDCWDVDWFEWPVKRPLVWFWNSWKTFESEYMPIGVLYWLWNTAVTVSKNNQKLLAKRIENEHIFRQFTRISSVVLALNRVRCPFGVIPGFPVWRFSRFVINWSTDAYVEWHRRSIVAASNVYCFLIRNPI